MTEVRLIAHSLEKTILLLLHLPHIDVIPHQHRAERDNVHAYSDDERDPMSVAVRAVDGIANRALLLQLHRQIAVDLLERRRTGREILFQLPGQDIQPDGVGDGAADGIADLGDHRLYGQDGGDVTLRHGGHEVDLFTDDERTPADTDEDEAHAEEADVVAGAAEVDHQTHPEDGDGYGEQGGVPLGAAKISDDDAEDQTPETRNHRVDVADVRGVGDALVEGDLEQLREVDGVVPRLVRHVQGGNHGVGEDDRRVLHDPPRDESDGCEEDFVQSKDDDQTSTDHD